MDTVDGAEINFNELMQLLALVTEVLEWMCKSQASKFLLTSKTSVFSK